MRLNGPWRPQRPLAVGKTLYVRELRGRLIACKWPRRRPRPTNPTTVEQNEKFRQANWMTKYVPADIQMAYRQMVEGTSLLPRDLMVAAMYGRGFTWQNPNERRRYPVAALRDLSDTLDILGAVPGDVIGRGPDRWYAIQPAASGLVLVSQPAGQAPQWQGIAPGSGIWQQIEDVTLGANLGAGVYRNVSVPAGIKTIAFWCLCPTATFQVSPNIRVNGLATAVYNHVTTGISNTNAFISTRVPANTKFFHFISSQVVANNLMHIHGTLTLRANGSTAMMESDGITGQVSLSKTTGWVTLPAATGFTQISFANDLGSGLPAGTRIIVQAA